MSCNVGWAGELLAPVLDECFPAAPGAAPDVVVEVERSRRPFGVASWAPLSREVRRATGAVAIRDAATSGFDLVVRIDDVDRVEVRARWRPPRRTRLASLLLRSRFHLLVRAILVQYPTLWRAALRGRAPLHAPACRAGSRVALLAGPGGVGKSTLIARQAAIGEGATSDNLAVGDGVRVWGVAEPLRIEPAAASRGGRRMPHGRTEQRLVGRVEVLTPELIVVLRRTPPTTATPSPLGDLAPRVVSCSPADAAAAVTCGTYMAGELRRFWGLAAAVALGTGRGPGHPPVAAVAEALAQRLPAIAVALPSLDGIRLDRLLADALAPADTEGQATAPTTSPTSDVRVGV